MIKENQELSNKLHRLFYQQHVSAASPEECVLQTLELLEEFFVSGQQPFVLKAKYFDPEKHEHQGMNPDTWVNDPFEGLIDPERRVVVRNRLEAKEPARPAVDWTEWHSFSIEWSPDGFIFKIDGQSLHESTGQWKPLKPDVGCGDGR